MLEVASYRVDGVRLRVRLKCSCGGSTIRKILKDNDVYYQCGKCHGQSSLRQLKNEATAFWRERIWEVECEEPQKKETQGVGVNYPATLEAKAHRYAPPYCVLTGHCVGLSATELLFTARNFKKDYLVELNTNHRFALVQFPNLIPGLPGALRGSIVEIKYRGEELPVSQIRVAFQELSENEQKLLASHLEGLQSRTAEHSVK